MSRVLEPRLLSAAPVLRRAVIGYALLAVIGTVLTLAQAGVLAELIAGIVAGGTHQLTRHLVTLAVVGVLRALTAGALEWLAASASTRTRAQLRAAVLGAVRRLGPSWVTRQPAGRLVTAAGPGLEALDGYVARALPASVAALIAPVAVLARIGWADWRTALILLACLPLVPLFMALVGVTTRNRMRRQYEILARIAGHFLDLVSGLPTLRVYGRTDHQLRTVRAATESYRRHTMATLRVAFLSGLVLDLIATLSVAVVAVDVGLRLDHRSLSLSTALLVLLLAPELFAPLRALGAQHHASELGRAAAEAALAVIDEAEAVEAVEAGGPGRDTAVQRADGALSLRGVRVRYPERGEPALDGVDLDIAAGSVVALRGPSGGGKSTLLSCVLGLTAPVEGTITVRVDGTERDLAGLDLASWRAGTAWLAQRPRTTHATVGEEVACGDPDATEREVADAIATCHAPHPRTPLGEAASRISAGQLRRVALARAVLRARRVAARGSVPIVLLDEPSEDLDRETELVVAAVVAHLAGTATVVMATHSDALAEVADRVVRIDSGRVVGDVTQAPLRMHVVPREPARRPPAQVVPTARPQRVTVPLRSRGVIAAAALCGLTGLAGLALTATSLWLICRAAQHPNIQALAVAVVGVRTFALARSLLRYGERLVTHDTALRLLSDVRVRVFAALVPLVPRGIDLRRGDALRRFVTDVDGLQDGLVRAVVPIAGAALTSAGAIVLATALTPAAGAILAAGLVLGLVVTPAAVRWAAGRGERAAALAAARDTATASFLDGIAELTVYGADARVADRITALDADFGAAVRRPGAAGVAGVVATGIVGALTLPAVLSAGAAAVNRGSSGALTVPVLAGCVLVGFDALSGLPVAWAAWNGFRAGLTRVAQLLGAPVPVPEPEPAACPPVGAVWLRGEAVGVAPAIGVAALVHGLDLEIGRGERVALIGPSGCGKSTVLAAALRLAPVRAGHLTLGDQLRSVAIESLASADVPPLVAGSLQGDHVFDATLRDNLRVVRPEATDAQLDAVAARVNLDGFVHGLPMGWDTPAGADGSALSGGQRQRLLLARALLADPKILVLDEPTAHLDPDTERAVLRDVLAVTAGRTVLMSTHRDLPEGAIDAVHDLAAHDRVIAEAGRRDLIAQC